eukprot:m.173005 g.173005  ORF g.173005 m.173005 type:complete len:1101 (-) comp16727_c0_seq5:310-3612(-)
MTSTILLAVCTCTFFATTAAREYRVGVLYNDGDDFAQRYGTTFTTFLTTRIGSTFNPPISFKAVPVSYDQYLDAGAKRQFDFSFANPSLYSCLETESQFSALLTLRNYHGQQDLAFYGGAIVTRHSGRHLRTLADLPGKRISAVSFTSLAGLYMQWGTLVQADVSLLTDTSQVVFTEDRVKALDLLLDGQVDAAFLPTSTLELFVQRSNDTYTMDDFHILGAKTHALSTGQVFPFFSSTDLYPEWPLSFNPSTVPSDVALAVMYTLLNLTATSPEALAGGYAGWQPASSYAKVRDLHNTLNILREVEPGEFACVRASNQEETTLLCPFGYRMLASDDIERKCEKNQLACPESATSCICQPCVPICESTETIQDDGITCRCKNGYTMMYGSCAPSILSTLQILLPVLLILGVIGYIAVKRQARKQDALFHINPKELKFGDPPEVLGAGSFGVVLAAEYRGTNVAVKKVGKADDKAGSKGHQTANTSVTGRSRTRLNRGERAAKKLKLAFLQGNDTVENLAESDGMNSKIKLHSTYTTLFSWKTVWEKVLPGALKRRWKLQGLQRSFMNEMRILSKLRHPNICQCFGAVLVKGIEPMMVMEHMSLGSLHSLVHNDTLQLEGDVIFNFITDLVSGMHFLHAHKPALVHADLKSQNCLVDNLYRLKVADFGLSTTNQESVNAGTICWMAPEVLLGEPVTTASDVYSAGVVIYEIVSRKEPYPDYKDVNELVKDISKRKRRPILPHDCAPEVAGIVTECWNTDPDWRPGFKELNRRFMSMDSTVVTQAQTKVVKTGSDRLLEQVFPKHVADALKAGKKVEPQQFESVTIFFSDIVGFTDISGSLPPEEVMDMLDRLYTKLDELSDKYDLFKVETIGDAFMCVSNLHKEQHDDHVKRIALFSMDAIEAANSTPISLTDAGLGNIQIRVGFHTGPVVANVVGSKNPRYCLFGDTVNVSSRMESNSEKNRIHLSDTSTKLLRKQAPELRLESRGLTHIKGKGKMRTSFLVEHEMKGRQAGPTTFAPSGVKFALASASTSARPSRVSSTWQPAMTTSAATSGPGSRRGTGRASMQLAALQLVQAEQEREHEHVVISLDAVEEEKGVVEV